MLLRAALLLGALLASVPTASAQTLDIWVSSSVDKAYYEEVAASYREAGHPDFELSVSAYGFTELADKLALAIRTRQNPPDIVQLDENFFSLYLSGDKVPFLDLTERLQSSGLAESIVPERLSLFSYGGRTYGVPQSLSAVVLYYRHDIFAEHGVSADDIETWDDFTELGGQVLGESGAEALITLDPAYWEMLLRQRGGDLYDADGQLQVESDDAVRALTWLVELKDAGLANDPPRGSIYDPPYLTQVLGGDQVLTVMSPDWFGLDYLKGIVPEMAGEWRAMPLPAWADDPLRRRTSTYAGQGLLIYAGSDAVDPAWEFVRFVMGETEPNVQRFLQNNSLTAYRPAWDDERLFEPDPYF
ncbi:MAG: hypothetical protein AVDCRST_MAG86-3220, partial [uncultured Truepera sp.]